jgi:hypothetical protein
MADAEPAGGLRCKDRDNRDDGGDNHVGTPLRGFHGMLLSVTWYLVDRKPEGKSDSPGLRLLL